MKQVSNVFCRLAQNVPEGLDRAAPTPEAVAAALLAEFTPAERADLAAFLDRLFVEGAGACRRAWRKSGSNVFFLRSADLVGFLRLIRAGL